MFTDIIHNLFNTYVSPLQLLLIVLGIIACAGVLFIILAYIGACYDEKKIKSHIIIKSLIIAIAPLLSEFSYLINKPITDTTSNIIFTITIIVVLIWNVLTIGVIKGILFTLVNFGLALVACIGVFTVVTFAIIGIGGWLFGKTGGDSPSENNSEIQSAASDTFGNNGHSSASVPEYLINVSTNQSYYVTTNTTGDVYYINGSTIVRKVDNNRYIDDHGNTYISHW